jgi:protein CpxP
MKSKLLPIILTILILLNGVLIFMLIKKPHQNKKNDRNFLTKQLEFTDIQNKKFISFDDFHKETMKGLDHKIRKHKDLLFNSFSDNTINIDSLSQIIGKLEGEKEGEVFRFFKSVRNICSKEQQQEFDNIINNALKGGKKESPKDGRNHPPRKGTMPPPR